MRCGSRGSAPPRARTTPEPGAAAAPAGPGKDRGLRGLPGPRGRSPGPAHAATPAVRTVNKVQPAAGAKRRAGSGDELGQPWARGARMGGSDRGCRA